MSRAADTVELVAGRTRVAHEDPDIAAAGYVGTFLGWHHADVHDQPHEFIDVQLDDGDEIAAYAGHWVVLDETRDETCEVPG